MVPPACLASQRGFINGLSQTAVAIVRLVAPLVVSPSFALTEDATEAELAKVNMTTNSSLLVRIPIVLGPFTTFDALGLLALLASFLSMMLPETADFKMVESRGLSGLQLPNIARTPNDLMRRAVTSGEE